jgi:hypothetical protein
MDLARLAHEKPEMRAFLVPLLRKEAFNKENPVELLSQLMKVVRKRGFGALADAIKRSDLMEAIQKAVDKRSGVADMTPEQKAVWMGRVARSKRAAAISDFLGNGERLAMKIAKACRALGKKETYGDKTGKTAATGFIYILFRDTLGDQGVAQKLWDIFEGSGVSLDPHKGRDLNRQFGRAFRFSGGDYAQDALYAAAVSLVLLRKMRLVRVAKTAEMIFTRHFSKSLASATPAPATPARKPGAVFDEQSKKMDPIAGGVLAALGGSASKAQTFASDVAENVNWRAGWKLIGEGDPLDERDPSASDVGQKIGYWINDAATFIVSLLRQANLRGLAQKVKRQALREFPDSYEAL